MNSVNLTGRLTRDPEVRYTDGGTSIARFSVAVDRKFTQENGLKQIFQTALRLVRQQSLLKSGLPKE